MTRPPFGMTHEQADVAWEALQQFVDNQPDWPEDGEPEYEGQEMQPESEARKVAAAQAMIDQFETYFAGLAG